jgi:predicted Zn-dependent peptidase
MKSSRFLLAIIGTGLIVPASQAAAAAPGENRIAYSLRNGMRVRLVPDPKAKGLFVLLGTRAGIFAEPAGQPHLAHVAEHLLAHAARPGTPEGDAFARWFSEGRGNAETTAGMMYFDLKVVPEDLGTALRLQAIRLSAPSFPRESLAREIPRALAEVENLEKSEMIATGKFANSAFVQAAFYGQTQIPLKEKTRSFSIGDLERFWSTTFHPDQAIVIVAGNFDPAAARKEIDSAFGKIAAPKAAARTARPKLKPGPLSATWDVATRHLLLGWPAPRPSDPAHPALSVAALALMQRLYSDPDVASQTSFPDASNEIPGLFYVNLPVKPGVDLKTLETKVLAQVGRLSQPSDLELAQSRTGLAQVLRPIDLDSIPLPPNVPRILALGNMELQKLRYELAWGDLSAYAKRVELVSTKSLREAATRHLRPANATVVRLGPMGKAIE